MDKIDESNDETFIGELTLKEIKLRLYANDCELKQILAHTANYNEPAADNTSFELIKTHSQPNLRPGTNCPELLINPDFPDLQENKPECSFKEIPRTVLQLCLSPRNAESNNNYNPDINVVQDSSNTNKSDTEKYLEIEKLRIQTKTCENKKTHQTSLASKLSTKQYDLKVSSCKKVDDKIKDTARKFTPVKNTIIQSKINGKHIPVFKTPYKPVPKNTESDAMKTPSKTNNFQHIKSPVASYIKNCSQVLVVKNVHPRLPLPGPSSIPKLMKHTQSSKKENIENTYLPTLAYKSAKKTEVINVADKDVLPQGQWTNKIKSNMCKATVMKHGVRQYNPKGAIVQQTDTSFDNLPCVQAEVSVCTEMTAFKK